MGDGNERSGDLERRINRIEAYPFRRTPLHKEPAIRVVQGSLAGLALLLFFRFG